MKLKLLLLTFILVCTGCKNDPRIQAAYDLIERVTPGYGEQFKLELMEPIDGMDAYMFPGSAINWTCRSNCPCPPPLKTRSTANTVSI